MSIHDAMSIPDGATRILGNGYLRLVEAWGTGDGGTARDYSGMPISHDDCEVGIIEAARQSTQGAFRGWETDAKLLKHLFNNGHTTPFEFSGMTIEVQAPILVFREWHRHRTQAYSEMSARYAPLPDVHYLPSVERALMNVGTANKQAAALKDAPVLDAATAMRWLARVDKHYREEEDIYQEGLRIGMPKELARVVHSVARFSRMRATASLRNWLAFMTLRCDPLAQWEIRQYAWEVYHCVERCFPQTLRLWHDKVATRWEEAA